MSLGPGDLIDGKHRIVRLLGEGAMGRVFLGENERIKRQVAIKVLHATLNLDESMVRRFEREAQAAARIGSDHIADVLDLGELPSGERYIVMEYVDGESLRSRMDALGRMTPEQLLPMVGELLDGLGAAHAAGVVHRDLKPDNVLLARDHGGRADFVKILDFGVSKFQEPSALSPGLTASGVVMGTPYYMAPEQAQGRRDIDGRVDLFSVGVLMYRGLSGSYPWPADSFSTLLLKLMTELPVSLDAVVPGLPAGLWPLIQRALARNRDDRYGTAEEFRAAIRAWLQQPAIMPQVSSQPNEPACVSGLARLPAARVRGITGRFLAAVGLVAVFVIGMAVLVAMRRSHANDPGGPESHRMAVSSDSGHTHASRERIGAPKDARSAMMTTSDGQTIPAPSSLTATTTAHDARTFARQPAAPPTIAATTTRTTATTTTTTSSQRIYRRELED